MVKKTKSFDVDLSPGQIDKFSEIMIDLCSEHLIRQELKISESGDFTIPQRYWHAATHQLDEFKKYMVRLQEEPEDQDLQMY